MLIQLIIIQVVAFFAIVFVLRWLLYAESAREVRRLKDISEESLREQKELQNRIAESEELYRRKLAEAEEAARALKEKAREETDAMKEKIMDKAKAEADNIVKTALNTREKIREEISLEIRKSSPFLAGRIFKEILSEPAKKVIHRELVCEAVKKIKQAKKSLFSAKVKKGELISAYALSKNDKDDLASSVSEKMGHKIILEEKEDRSIACGAIIKIGTLVIDASLDNRLRQVEDELSHSQHNSKPAPPD